MPPSAWTGYGRFCPLARALDVVGERWTLVIVQELLKRPSRYGDLARRLPGIGTSVLADRLRKLEAARVVERVPGPVGEGVVYALTDRGRGLNDAMEALRRWGVAYLTDPTADGSASHEFDLHYVEGIDALHDAEFGLVVDGQPTTLRFSRGHLDQAAGEPADPILTVHTSSAFMDRWAAGTASWDDGRTSGQVTLDGPDRHWDTWLAATGYLLTYHPEPAMREYTAPKVQPVHQRLRAWRAGQLLLDTYRAHLYFPDDRHPRWAVPAGDLLLPAPGAFIHDGLVVLSPGDADAWVEEDRQTYGEPRNPYHRVDALPSSRHIQVLAGQAIVAETSRPVLLIETGVAPRWYIPPGDVAWEQLEPDPARTTCQYKGEASYFRVRNTDVRLWTYRHPDPEAAAIAGHLAAAAEQPGVQVIVDGTPDRSP